MIKEYIKNICENAQNAKPSIGGLSTYEKNDVLIYLSEIIRNETKYILDANKKDMETAEKMDYSQSFLKRLALDETKVIGLSKALEDVARLKDPIGEFVQNTTLENGLIVGQKRVPLGVIGVIYESRPNVTIDVFALCFKASNICILKGGKEAHHTNMALHTLIAQALKHFDLDENICQLVSHTDRKYTTELMKQKDYIDLLIPRGSQNLINAVATNSNIPVIETGVGNCHIYVDNIFDEKKALDIIINGKTQRPDVCNATETLLIHRDIYKDFLPKVIRTLKEKQVELRLCQIGHELFPEEILATEEDYRTEFLDLILAIKIVDSLDDAIDHINKYNSLHSEVIISENYSNIQKFLNDVDAAVVYANASSRFTDGGAFGFGAEIGISTQKLHARGPMGLKEITTTKYVVYGNGQVR